MPLNLLKKYNELLDIDSMSESQRRTSLMGVFDRDIRNNANFSFNNKQLQPTPEGNGEESMQNLFTHLTTVITDKQTKHREFDRHRAIRLHWIKPHLNAIINDEIYMFSVKEPQGIRTYIYNHTESYVIVLEPLRKANEYYLLTQYYVRGKDAKRKKFLKKFNRDRLPEIH